MNEFKFEGKWRKFVVEGAIEGGQSDFVAKEMEKDLGVLVTPASYNPNDDKVVIYPDLKPGEGNRVGRTSQRITLQLNKEEGTELVSIFGQNRGLDLIGEPYGSTQLAGFGIWMPSENRRPEVDYDEIKTYIIQLRRGLEAEAKAQRDFYKNWQNPD